LGRWALLFSLTTPVNIGIGAKIEIHPNRYLGFI